MERNGYSVQIKRKDGTTFLACGAIGLLPPVWALSQRRYAAQHRDELKAEGFDARVVRVLFTPPAPATRKAF